MSAFLSSDEIEDELNNDLIDFESTENDGRLHEMSTEEKKKILSEVKQSKEELCNQPTPKSTNSQKIDITDSNFPSLSSAGKNYSRNKLQLPRRSSTGLKPTDPDESSDKCTSLLNDDKTIVKFSLPFYADDGAPPLIMDRPLKYVKNPYYVRDNESPGAALQRMIDHHDAWKAKYSLEISKIYSHALVDEIEDSNNTEQSATNDKDEEQENDPYDFKSDSPVSVSKVYNIGRKRETKQGSDNVSQSSSRQLQRKTSRDSDCEEVETILKPEEHKMSEWINTARPGKRNRKQVFNKEKAKIFDGSPEVVFDFEEKWDSRSVTWQGTKSSSLNSHPNQATPRRNVTNAPVVEEEKVQCPICQKNFALSKVENHAATCEGYSPMDIEEES